MREVQVGAVALDRFASVLPPERVAALEAAAVRAAEVLAGHTVWNVNSTEHGGGVAEMPQTLLAYGRGAGIDTRWFVIGGDDRFFTVTKRLHNLLHGFAGDGGELDAAEEILQLGEEENPEAVDIIAAFALLYIRKQDLDTAQEYLEEAERLDPGLEQVQMVRMIFDAAKEQERQQRKQKSKQHHKNKPKKRR